MLIKSLIRMIERLRIYRPELSVNSLSRLQQEFSASGSASP